MTEAEKMQQIIVDCGTVSDRIRYLWAAGYSKVRIADFLGKRYQHVRNVIVQDEAKAAKGGESRRTNALSRALSSMELCNVGNEVVTHRFALRPELEIKIDLPRNLTQRESERIAAFVQALPL